MDMNAIMEKTKAKLAAEGALPKESAADVSNSATTSTEETVNTSTTADKPLFEPRKFAVEDEETGETFEMELDESNLKDLVLKAKRAEYREGEIKAIKDEYTGRKAALESREKELKALLSAAETNPEIKDIFELAKSKGSLEEWKRKIIDEHTKYMNLSDDERKEYDLRREKAEVLKREKALQDQLDAQVRKQDEREKQLRRQEKLVLYQGAFRGNSFENAAKDPAIERLNKTIFNNAAETLAKMEKEGVTLTEAIITREFKKEFNILNKTVNSRGKESEVRQAINTLDNSAAAVQAKGGNKSKGETETDVVNRWKEMIAKGRGADVVKEAYSNEALLNLYVAKGKSLIAGRSANKPALGSQLKFPSK